MQDPIRTPAQIGREIRGIEKHLRESNPTPAVREPYADVLDDLFAELDAAYAREGGEF